MLQELMKQISASGKIMVKKQCEEKKEQLLSQSKTAQFGHVQQPVELTHWHLLMISLLMEAKG